MSRIGKKPVPVPADVTVSIKDGLVAVKGKGGELKLQAHPKMAVSFDATTREVKVVRPDDTGECRALHGLTRALINNMVRGVVAAWEKKLEIQGVGYQAALAGKTLTLKVGFANDIKLTVPANVTVEVPDQTHIVVKSSDRQAAGQFAAQIRSVRPPEPYKGKGIRYVDERVRRKAGKAFGS